MFDFSTNAKRKEAWLFLEVLWEGLEYLCQQVQQEERERARSGKNFAYCDFGNQPGDAMLCNHFLWYATALYNFILVFQQAFSPSENLERRFREVLRWRHEVAAHALWALRKKASRKKQSMKRAQPNKRDVAKQDMSVMLFPEFNFQGDGHLEIGGMMIIPPRGDTFSTSNAKRRIRSDWRWGVVHTHERLTEIVSKYACTK
jgi:hypothetical protein